MKYAKRQLFFFAGYLAVGILLAAAAALWAPAGQREGILSGIAGGFGVTGLGGLFLSARLLKNPGGAEQAALAKTEERTQFLRLKTRSAVHAVLVPAVCIGTFAALIGGYRQIALTLSALLASGVLLSVGFGVYYAKKY